MSSTGTRLRILRNAVSYIARSSLKVVHQGGGGGAGSFGGVVVDHDRVKFIMAAKQDPLIVWRNS